MTPTGLKAVRTDRELEMEGVDAALRAAGVEVTTLADGVSEDALIESVREADLLLMCYTPVSARVIGAATKLKGIVKYGVGIDAIDIPTAMARRIPVVNVPDYAEQTVAEGAFALMIALAKKLVPITREMDARGWAWPTAHWMGLDLAGRTLGVVGVGRIGSSMARMAAGFRMRVVGFDPHVSAETMAAAGVERCDDLHAMMAMSDVVSIHTVLSAATHHLIDAAALAAMKPSAFLINVSRGAIVDEDALVAALVENRIAGAALDVYSREPLLKNGHPMSVLFGMDHVILFPHLTFYTAEAMARLEADILARCFEILQGRPVVVRSHDPRLRAQVHGVVFDDT